MTGALLVNSLPVRDAMTRQQSVHSLPVQGSLQRGRY
jgi:hypothetical protein